MNSGTTLYEEALALRADVREIVILLENWNTGRQPTRGGGGATPPTGIAPMMVRPEGQEQMRHGADCKRVEIRHGEGRPGSV